MASILDFIMPAISPDYQIPKPSGDNYSILADAAERHGLSDKLPLLQRIMQAESGGKTDAVSPKGARGPMQLMPGTAKSLGVKNIDDPYENIDGGVRYFKEQLNTFGDDALALAAYNAGPNRVKKAGGVPNIKETQQYVQKILSPINGTMGGGFNDPRGDRLHYGGDISAAAGTPFIAPTRLRITNVRDQMSNSPGGMVWGIDPSSGLQFRFHHVVPGVKEGAMIEPGAQLGTLSNISGPHLDMKVFDPRTGQFIDWTPNLKRGMQFSQGQPLAGPMPDTSAMVADASGQVTPQVQRQVDPQKEKTIGQILGSLAQNLGPKEAAAAEPPKASILDDIMAEVSKPTAEEIRTENNKVPITGGTLTPGPVLPGEPPQQPTQSPSMSQLINMQSFKDPNKLFEYLGKIYFPQEAPPMAAKRFRTDKDGNILYIDENNQEKYVIPQTWSGWAKNKVAQLIKPNVSVPALAATAATLATGGATLPIAAAGLGGMAGETIREGQARLLGDTARPIGEVTEDIAKEGLTAAGAEAAGIGLTKLANKGYQTMYRNRLMKEAATDTAILSSGEVAKLQSLASKYGVELTAPELTNSKTLMQLFRYIRNAGGKATDDITEFLKNTREPQISSAINRVLKEVSPVEGATKAGQAGNQAAKDIVKNAEWTQNELTNPMYRQAFDNSGPVDLKPVIEKIDAIKSKFGPNTDQAAFLGRVRKKLLDNPVKDQDTGKMIEKPLSDLETIHNAKTEIDAMFADFDQVKVFKKNQERMLQDIKKSIYEQMDMASPEYAEARAKFYEHGKALKDIQYADENLMPKDKRASSIVKEIIDTPQANIHTVHNKIFDNENYDTIKKARDYFVASGNEDTWNAMVRARLEEKLNPGKDTVARQEGSAGAEWFHTVWGGQKGAVEREKLRAALGPDKYKNFSDFMDLMKATTRIMYNNSETAFMLNAPEVAKRYFGGFKGAVIDTLRTVGKIRNLAFNQEELAKTLERQWTPSQMNMFVDKMMDPNVAV